MLSFHHVQALSSDRPEGSECGMLTIDMQYSLCEEPPPSAGPRVGFLVEACMHSKQPRLILDTVVVVYANRAGDSASC